MGAPLDAQAARLSPWRTAEDAMEGMDGARPQAKRGARARERCNAKGGGGADRCARRGAKGLLVRVVAAHSLLAHGVSLSRPIFWPRFVWEEAVKQTNKNAQRVHKLVFRPLPRLLLLAMSSAVSPPTLCAACGASTSLVCASCLKARFCSPACAAAAWAGHRAACAEFSVLARLPDEALAPVPLAAPLASMEPAAGAGAGAFENPGTGFECAVCGKSDAAVCARCRLVGYCGAEHQRKDWPRHKAVCRKGETRVVPVLTWEQRMLAEAAAAAPASLAATAALPPIPDWNIDRDGASPTKIMRAWCKAADGGHAGAQTKLGYCCEYGKGVVKDAIAAAEWYAKAAAQGNAGAQFNLGVLYADGAGVAQDFKSAAAWYAKAAAQGDADSQNNLGALYKNGTGVARDLQAAAACFAKAAAQGHASAQFNLGALYGEGSSVAPDMAAAVSWYARAAAQGFAKAQLNLGRCLMAGAGAAQDPMAAAAWYAKAAAQGEADAQHSLGRCYESGAGAVQDVKAAAAWYAKAAAQGHAKSQCNLGVLFAYGKGVAQDLKAAAAWFAKAAAQGFPGAAAAFDNCQARIAAAAAAASRP